MTAERGEIDRNAVPDRALPSRRRSARPDCRPCRHNSWIRPRSGRESTTGTATLDVGFEVGVPWSLHNIGVDVFTPSVGVTGGVTAGVQAPLTIGPTGPSAGNTPSIGAHAGATVTVLPSREVTFRPRSPSRTPLPTWIFPRFT
ncbi:MspA family porin [Nocardia terpenica]|uniref:MspA family porin n=1 Tax=Nocardia terpenica TaxID=455432 RepID=UPI003980EC4B